MGSGNGLLPVDLPMSFRITSPLLGQPCQYPHRKWFLLWFSPEIYVDLSHESTVKNILSTPKPWRRYQMETFSALLASCAGNSPVPGEFPALRPVTRGVDVFFDLRLNKRLSKQSWGWWFETLSCPVWRHCNAKPLKPCIYSMGCTPQHNNPK